ncbi:MULTISPECIES: alpha/beta fold hydrolase [Corallococcus]|uniref:alpha/beta fold hydrolase n=1 Tax=Corallococcus TaxID=83461 RepID=UPI00117DAF7C|nr:MULTISPECIES: alpha/beta hydrolase [Corallococcus]NBD14496.1 alpha/beta fold hydrolase [Corallococcus silvisoli]TSC25029.1 alpha/beta hydrolase [Corallococcus sp. Z5C101001]
MPAAAFESLTVDAEGLPLHVRQRHPHGTPAVLFLHGWLDHSHSFDPLSEFLPEAWRTVLLDLRGMGESGHAGPGAAYHFSDHLLDVEAALDGLALPRVHLVGHSLGGIVALAYAAARPERIQSLTLIESLGPSGGPPEGAPVRLRSFLEDSRRPPNRKRYPSVEAAAERLRHTNPTLSPDAALLFARHGTRLTPEGDFTFTFDPRHRRRFGQAFDEAQWLALEAAVTCPVQLLRGTRGLSPTPALLEGRLAALRTLVGPARFFDGGHHVHLEQPAAVAAAIAAFVGEASTS